MSTRSGPPIVITSYSIHYTKLYEKVGLTGVVLTKMDGDARGGAALSIRAVTGAPIKFVGVGEKTDALEASYNFV